MAYVTKVLVPLNILVVYIAHVILAHVVVVHVDFEMMTSDPYWGEKRSQYSVIEISLAPSLSLIT
jgi:hypothetical protein